MESPSQSQSLPIDVIYEILLRLPVKSLVRCKAVCRSWRGVIENKRFMELHYCHESHVERLVFEKGDYVDGAGFEEGNNGRVRLPYLGESFWYLLGPVNGIICEVGWGGAGIVLLNPATHKVKRVPPFPFKVESPTGVMLGFGYDPLSEDYKIVAFYTEEIDVFMIYKSSSDCWNPILNMDPRLLRLMQEGYWNAKVNIGELWNGVFYWALMAGDGRYCKEMAGMVGFDMMSEKFSSGSGMIQGADEVAGDFVMISSYGEDSIAVVGRDTWDRSDGFWWVMAREKDGCWIKCLADDKRLMSISKRVTSFPVCLWKNQLVAVRMDRDTEDRKWVIREFYLLHLSSSTQQQQEPLVPHFSDKSLVSPAYVLPFSYKDSLFPI